jgi:dihydroorotase
VPDAISTDLHRYSIEHPVVDLPTTVSRFIALGMPLEAVVAATTSGPAAILGRPDLGTLRVGGPADITVLAEDSDRIDLPDAEGVRRPVAPMLRAVWTMAGGELYRSADVEVSLRPFLDADREVDCRVPI